MTKLTFSWTQHITSRRSKRHQMCSWIRSSRRCSFRWSLLCRFRAGRTKWRSSRRPIQNEVPQRGCLLWLRCRADWQHIGRPGTGHMDTRSTGTASWNMSLCQYIVTASAPLPLLTRVYTGWNWWSPCLWWLWPFQSDCRSTFGPSCLRRRCASKWHPRHSIEQLKHRPLLGNKLCCDLYASC